MHIGSLRLSGSRGRWFRSRARYRTRSRCRPGGGGGRASRHSRRGWCRERVRGPGMSDAHARSAAAALATAPPIGTCTFWHVQQLARCTSWHAQRPVPDPCRSTTPEHVDVGVGQVGHGGWPRRRRQWPRGLRARWRSHPLCPSVVSLGHLCQRHTPRLQGHRQRVSLAPPPGSRTAGPSRRATSCRPCRGTGRSSARRSVTEIGRSHRGAARRWSRRACTVGASAARTPTSTARRARRPRRRRWSSCAFWAMAAPPSSTAITATQAPSTTPPAPPARPVARRHRLAATAASTRQPLERGGVRGGEGRGRALPGGVQAGPPDRSGAFGGMAAVPG
ncbi:MAG: hypothetical protein JWQ53_2801, partial [Klenkia sp.]|nr:hypothetical protein [Klenkia sp.]